MPRGDISSEGGGGEGGRSFKSKKYITGTYLKVFLPSVSLRHFVFL